MQSLTSELLSRLLSLNVTKLTRMNEPLRITSRDNQHLKFARRVRDRKEPDFIFIEGKRLCQEAASSGLEIETVFVSETFAEVSTRGSFVVSNSLIASIADTDSPQGIVTIARRPANRQIDELFATADPQFMNLWICLEKTNNPSNLGAVIRTAESAGASGVIVTTGSADPYAPKSLRASMGSAFRIPIAWGIDASVAVEAAKTRGVAIVAMASAGDSNYLDYDWKKSSLLVVGSEADGVSKGVLDRADHLIRIDMRAPVESLNLAVSTGVVLFEAARQNRASG